MNMNSKNTKASEMIAGMNKVSFRSGNVQLAGLLFTPKDFDLTKKYPTVVFSGPFNQIKEQMGSDYGREMSSRGYVFLSFDHIGYGDSEGEKRNNEKFEWKAEGIRDAVSYLSTLEFVDKDRLFGLGGCASGGYMPLVATTDKRIKAVSTVSGMMSNYTSYFESMPKEMILPIFDMANAARQREYETGVTQYYDALGMEETQKNPALQEGNEGYDYYMTDRAGALRFANYTHMTVMTLMEDAPMTDAIHYAPYLYTPYIGIVGEKAFPKEGEEENPLHTGPLTQRFYEACSEPKELVVISGATHVSLYDIENDVKAAVDAMDAFFKKHEVKILSSVTLVKR